MRIRMRSAGHNQGQIQSLMTGYVHSDKEGPRSIQEVILQLKSPSQWGLWPRTGMSVAELGTNMT